MTEAQDAMLNLVEQQPQLEPVLSCHLADYDELLPTLFLAEVVDWVVQHQGESPDLGRDFVMWMNTTFDVASDELQTIIATGGVEAIPDPGEFGSHLRSLLSPDLSAVDPWGTRWQRRGTLASG